MLRHAVLEHLAALPAATIPELIRLRATTHGSKAFVRLLALSGEERTMSFAEAHEAMVGAAEHLIAQGVGAGDVVPIVLDTSAELLAHFFGVMASGGIPVVLPAPLTAATLLATNRALAHLAPSFVITAVEGLAEAPGGFRVIPPVCRPATGTTALPALRPQDAALMQFSSGTTANPKGILLTHYNVLANCEAFGRAAHITDADVSISWLPLFHDMGLIGTVIGSLYHGLSLILMSPAAFLMRPRWWLEAVGTYRATMTAAPNSALGICARRFSQNEAAALDLSSLRVIFCGAEMVREQTIRQFIERFQPSGLRPEALFPVYGLAENALAVTFPDLGADLVIDRVAMDGFTVGCRTVPSDQGTHFVGVGRPGLWQNVMITDSDGRELPEGTIGYVRIKGPCVMLGYHQDPEATAAVLQDGWLKTNDLAYFRDGILFICGRDSDLIIKAGRNISPTEIEDACQRLVPELTRLAAFGLYDEQRGTEALVLMVETRLTVRHEQDRLRLRIRSAVMQQCGVEVDHIWLVPPRTVPHTTSGKIQRRRCREMWNERKRV